MDEIFLKVTHQDEIEQESENSLTEAEETEILLDLSKSVKLIDDKKSLLKQQFRGAFTKFSLHWHIFTSFSDSCSQLRNTSVRSSDLEP